MVKQSTRVYNSIPITIADTSETVSLLAAEAITTVLKKKPSATLMLTTGATQQGTYALLRKNAPHLFTKATILNMYEYVLKKTNEYRFIDESDPRSFVRYMNEYFFADITPAHHYFPTLANSISEGTYDAFIASHGGIDFCFAAIGVDAHTFGFNLPGTSFDSQTRLVSINEENRTAMSQATGLAIPSYAITTGIDTGMQAKEILFIVTGKGKAQALRNALYFPISPDVPASILRSHPNCRWIVDEAAASAL